MPRQQQLDSPEQFKGFPWNEIPRDYPKKAAIEDILGQAAQEWRRRLEPTEFDLIYWRVFQAIASNKQLDFNSDECKGKTNSECLRLLLDCVLHHFESKETTGPPPISTPSAEMKLFSSTFLEVEYATNLLNHIASLSHKYYGDKDYHSPYVSLVQASMTGKSRVIKEWQSRYTASSFAYGKKEIVAILVQHSASCLTVIGELARWTECAELSVFLRPWLNN